MTSKPSMYRVSNETMKARERIRELEAEVERLKARIKWYEKQTLLTFEDVEGGGRESGVSEAASSSSTSSPSGLNAAANPAAYHCPKCKAENEIWKQERATRKEAKA